MSAVPKGTNDFRLVVNMRAANRAIKREYFRMPLIDEMKVKLHGAKYFSKLDLSNAYYHLELSPASRELTWILKRVRNVSFQAPATLEELGKTVSKVLQILRKNNLTLNISKCEFDRTHIKFLGHELDQQGFHVDEKKDRTILYTDASPNALGAVLVQENSRGHSRIISFASKTLTSTERRYAQNQREALGAVWGIEHFSYFLLGRHFVLRMDAQGVSFILNRSRENSKRTLTRADGWALRLSPYDYEIQYVRGRDNIADPSSRLYNHEHDEPFDEISSPWEVATIEVNSIGILTEAEIREATAKDKDLREVMLALETGTWSTSLSKFKSVADALLQNGLVEGYMKLVNKAMATAISSGTSYVKEQQAAVETHNAAAHSVTRVPPEEVLMGRKIRRRLPLLVGGSTDHDADLLNARDRRAKLLAKEYEYNRRGAKECRVKPGDVVIAERTARAKGDARFDPKKFTIMEEDNGNLVMCDDAGKIFRRHVSQTRKVKKWRNGESLPKADDAVDSNNSEGDTSGDAKLRRSVRDRKPPAHLAEYERICGLETLDRRSSE
ncbi:uncharacterized protein LOC129720073 [Wyeomyia smithii]|uniref:uncharacterized protein LOC129720073 n=1 Tax=Wyeomyia smithii TaxID=174621 RepID=UPI002467BF0A|nr:uncharacterized protein LOC129720073 [Wyeomyia smithii]